MSKTKYVRYGKKGSYGLDGFWAYDVALGVFLKHLIDAAEDSPHSGEAWLVKAIADWRFAAAMADFGLEPDPNWSSEQLQIFTALTEQACAELGKRSSIPADEVVSWPILNGERIFPRRAEEIETAAVIRLGHALVSLTRGNLPRPPTGKAWLYGTPEGPEMI